MKFSFALLKKLALIAVGLVVVTLLALWLSLPRLVQALAEKFVAEETGHRLVMERPAFDPFQLALRLGKLELSDAAGQPLLAFDGLLVDISGTSLTRRALVFDAIRIEAPRATVVELPDGKLNWTPFLEALKGKQDSPAPPDQGMPRFDIHRFELVGGRIDYADQRRAGGFATRVEPLELELTELSTLPDDAGKYRISARTALGARIDLDGGIDLNPLRVAGTLKLQDLSLARLAPYLADVLPAPPEGVAGLSASYRVEVAESRVEAIVETIEADLSDLRVPLGKREKAGVAVGGVALKGGRFDLAGQLLTLDSVVLRQTRLELPHLDRSLDLATIDLRAARIDLGARQASLDRLRLADGDLYSVRGPQGRIYLLEALQAVADAGPATAAAGAAARTPATQAEPWRFKLGKLSIENLNNHNRDESVTPPMEVMLKKISLEVDNITENLGTPLPVKLALDVDSGGHFEAVGRFVPATAAADIQFKLSDLALKPVQPYLTERTTLTLADGQLQAQGRAVHDPVSAQGTRVNGEFAVRDLRLMEPGNDKPLLAWKNLGSQDLVLTQRSLNLGELRLSGLNTRLLIDKDKNVNLARVLKSPPNERAEAPVAAVAAPPPASPAAAPAVPPAPDFMVNIDRLRFHRGELEFADQSLILPFGTRIHELKGSVAGLSNRPGAIGRIELDGAVDDYGMARAVGEVELGNPTNGLDVRVLFRNVEMTTLTPYTAHFAGRKIEAGKLSLDLQYTIRQRQLQGENQVIIDQLKLGDRVDHPGATNLPLDLAIALLRDSDGRIDLGLPVAGSLDDPQFSYGTIIWKAITNVLTKIVTAPFRALGALFGGDGGEKIDNIVFEAGAQQLTPPEREKVAKLAAAMSKRPALTLELGGTYTEADRAALQEVQLRRSVLVLADQRVPEKGDPGPISTQQPKVREILEMLYKDRIGAAELAALKEGYRGANPGQLEENMAGRVMSRLSGLLHEKKPLTEDEVAKLKGVDFHGELFERLRRKVDIPDERLATLARVRGDAVAQQLKAAGVAAERIRQLAPEKAKTEGDAPPDAPLRLGLEAAKAQ